MQIGDPRRTFTVEPIEDPVPRETPAGPPPVVPAEADPEPVRPGA